MGEGCRTIRNQTSPFIPQLVIVIVPGIFMPAPVKAIIVTFTVAWFIVVAEIGTRAVINWGRPVINNRRRCVMYRRWCYVICWATKVDAKSN